MTIGLVGRKSGMTRVFTEDGASIPVTVVEIAPNRVTQIKEVDSDGYRAIQVTAGNRKASKVSKSEAGQFAKAGVEAGLGLWEFRLADAEDAPEVGAELTVERFEAGQKVDVAGKSKGKGKKGGSGTVAARPFPSVEELAEWTRDALITFWEVRFKFWESRKLKE